MQKRFGQLIREVITSERPITEKQAICGYNRASMSSQHVTMPDVDDALSFLFTYPADAIDPETGHIPAEAWDATVSREWVMVYRYYPQEEPARSTAMAALNKWHANIPSTFGTMGKVD